MALRMQGREGPKKASRIGKGLVFCPNFEDFAMSIFTNWLSVVGSISVKRYHPSILTRLHLDREAVSFVLSVADLTSCVRVVEYESERLEPGPIRMPLPTGGKPTAEISRTQAEPARDGRNRGQRWSTPICARDE